MTGNAVEFDLIVVGFGKAGKTLAMKRAKAGDRVALIEQSAAMYGGTCINIGCVPTKTLLHYTGSHEGTGDVVWQDAVTVRDRLIAAMNAANLNMETGAGVTVITAHAEFVGPHELEISAPHDGATRLVAPHIVINTGAETLIPEVPGVHLPKVYTSTTIQHAPRPERLVIVGGGPIGIEFATMFAAVGTQVTIINKHSQLFGRASEFVGDEARRILTAQGIAVVNDAELLSISEDGTVATTQGDFPYDAVLLATGRTPATAGLGLERAGIAVDDRGAVVVDSRLRTSVPGVWAAGDVTGGPQFTYVSFDDHRIILPQLAGGTPNHNADDRLIPTATFMNPPLATVGLTAAAAEAAGHQVITRTALVKDVAVMPRPKILGHPEGALSIVVDAQNDQILGAELLCVDSQELINMVALAMRHGITATEVGAGIYTHPASAELFNGLLG